MTNCHIYADEKDTVGYLENQFMFSLKTAALCWNGEDRHAALLHNGWPPTPQERMSVATEAVLVLA